MADDVMQLTPAELRLLECAREGVEWKGRNGGEVLRAEVIAQLIAAPEHSPHALFRNAIVHPEGLFIYGAIVVGEYLNLDGVHLRTKLFFYDCIFTRDSARQAPDGGLCIRDAHATTISLERCRLLKIDARRAKIGGNLYLEDCAVVCGLNLHNCDIGGYMSILGCDLYSTEYDPADYDPDLGFDNTQAHEMFADHICAIDAEAITVKDSVVIGKSPSERSTRAYGQISLERAQIGGHLDCRGATIEGPLHPPEADDDQRIALHAAAIRVQGSALLGDGFRAEGEVRFEHAEIAGDFWCAGASFSNPLDKMEDAKRSVGAGPRRAGPLLPVPVSLNLRSAEVKEGIYLDDQDAALATSLDGRLILSNARCLVFCDSKGAEGDIVKPPGNALELDAFVYQRLGECTTSARKREAWLNSQIKDHIVHHFRPQPWKQLAAVLGEMGYNASARTIAMKRHVALRRSRSLSFMGKIMNGLLGLTIGHGYKPNLAVLWALVFVLPGIVVFTVAAEKGWMAPQRDSVLASAEYWERAECRLPQSYRRLNPALYTLDMFVPIIDSLHTSDWGPAPAARVCAQQTPHSAIWARPPIRAGIDRLYSLGLQRLFEQGFLELARWLLVVSGWILVPLFLAGLTGVVKRFET